MWSAFRLQMFYSAVNMWVNSTSSTRILISILVVMESLVSGNVNLRNFFSPSKSHLSGLMVRALLHIPLFTMSDERLLIACPSISLLNTLVKWNELGGLLTVTRWVLHWPYFYYWSTRSSAILLYEIFKFTRHPFSTLVLYCLQVYNFDFP